ncbi:MAG: hypothetical protein CYG60_21530 [Actinobacteria bacterium]|nr:MAG: hypothetical protein CYG60_21530 [Actinomycetota bacterium]
MGESYETLTLTFRYLGRDSRFPSYPEDWSLGMDLPYRCARCARPLPDGLKPPRPRSGRYREGAAGPVRVVKGGLESFYCWPSCWKKAHPERPGKTSAKRKKQKSQIKLRGSKTSPLDPVEDDAAA